MIVAPCCSITSVNSKSLKFYQGSTNSIYHGEMLQKHSNQELVSFDTDLRKR